MRDAGEDWFSCTMRTVEKIMERNGFEEDPKPSLDLPGTPISDEQSAWNKLLQRASVLFSASD